MGAVEIGDYAVGLGLHPLLQRVHAVDGVALFGIEAFHGVGDAGASTVEFGGDGFLLIDDLPQALLTPQVGVVKVYYITNKQVA